MENQKFAHKTKKGQVARKKLVRTSNDPLTSEEVNKLIQETIDLSDKTLFIIGFTVGLRVSEVVQIDESDIDFDALTIKIHDKKKDVERTGCINNQAKSAILTYLQTFPKKRRGSSLLFPVSTKTIERKIQYWTNKILGKKKSWHCVRHTYVSLSREKEIPMEAVIKNTGDSPITILKVYSQMSNEKVVKFMNERPLFKV